MQKITSQSKLYWLQWLQHGTLYVFWLQNYIYILLSFLKPRTLIPSKHCIVFFANREKKYISAKYYRNKEGGHLVPGYQSQEMSASQCNKRAGIHCLHEYPIFHFLFQLHD